MTSHFAKKDSGAASNGRPSVTAQLTAALRLYRGLNSSAPWQAPGYPVDVARLVQAAALEAEGRPNETIAIDTFTLESPPADTAEPGPPPATGSITVFAGFASLRRFKTLKEFVSTDYAAFQKALSEYVELIAKLEPLAPLKAVDILSTIPAYIDIRHGERL